MKYQNSEDIKNISYINKDFPMLWQEIVDLIPKLTNKWNPAEANESDPLAMLLKLIALFSDKINYNIDKSILEAFPGSLTQTRSAYSVYDILGYNPRWYRSATTSVSFTLNNALQGDVNTQYTIPALTAISDADDTITYTTLRDVIFAPNDVVGATSKEALSIQGTVNDYVINGSKVITLLNLDEDNKLYFTETNVAQNGVFISSSEEFQAFNLSSNTLLGDWKRVDNIYQVGADEKAFKFGIDPVTGACYVQFSDAIANLIGSGIYIKYVLSVGSVGNIKSNTLTKLTQESVQFKIDPTTDEELIVSDYVLINNLEATTNGYDPETINEMYKNYQKIKNVFDTLVTLRDYDNYIYNYTTAAGENVVSNIKTSDRTNDLYDSYNVLTLSLNQGEMEKHIVATSDGSVPKLNAYNIRFYPLHAVNNVFSDTAFKESFKSFESTAEASQWKDILLQVIEDAKTLNHDQVTPGKIIPVDYDLIGDIYLTERVSTQVANQIMEAVRSALRLKLNARELTLGEPISYKDVLDTIKNADSRIDYVALQPVQYVSEVDTAADTNLSKAQIISRNILAGTLPWTEYKENFSFSPNQANAAVYSCAAGNTVSSKIKVDNFTSGGFNSIFTLKSNENLSLLAPAYQEDVVYTNYLYFRYDNCPEVIAKDTPHKMGAGETLYFYETREDYNAAAYQHQRNAIYVLGPGTIVKFSFDFAKNSSINSLNQGKSIAKLKRSAGALTDGTNILFFTNSVALLTALSTSGNVTYTLRTSEYFLFKLADSISFTLFGEGTTIQFTAGSNSIMDNNNLSTYLAKLNNISVDWEGVQDGTASATTPFSEMWLPKAPYTTVSSLSGANVNYQVNQILNFSEGCGFGYYLGGKPVTISSSYVSFDKTDWFDKNSSDNKYYSNASKLFDAYPLNEVTGITYYSVIADSSVQPEEGTSVSSYYTRENVVYDYYVKASGTAVAGVTYYTLTASSVSPTTPDVTSYFIKSGDNYISTRGLQLYYTQNTNQPDWQALDILPDDNDKWQGVITLNINGSKEKPQELLITNISNEVSHEQLIYYENAALPNNSADLYVELTPALESAGVDVKLPVNVDVYSYNLNTSINYGESSTYFFELTPTESSGNWVSTWTNNLLTSNDYAIVPCYVKTSTDSPTLALTINNVAVSGFDASYYDRVFFVVVPNGEALTLAETGASTAKLLIGKNIAVALNTEPFGVYKYGIQGIEGQTTISYLGGKIITNSNSGLAAADSQSTDFDFSYVHIPSTNDLIDLNQPMSGESLLNRNNIVNVFTIPRLNSLKLVAGKWVVNTDASAVLFSNLKINKLSIK